MGPCLYLMRRYSSIKLILCCIKWLYKCVGNFNLCRFPGLFHSNLLISHIRLVLLFSGFSQKLYPLFWIVWQHDGVILPTFRATKHVSKRKSELTAKTWQIYAWLKFP